MEGRIPRSRLINLAKKVRFSGLMLSLVVLVFSGILASDWAQAAPTKLLNYQARITDPGGTPVRSGMYRISFRIYNAATGGSILWQEDQAVTLENGILDVQLGLTRPLNLDFNTGRYYLGVRIENDSELTPRRAIGAAPFALNASLLDGRPVGTDPNNILALDSNSNLTLPNNLTTGGNATIEGNTSIEGNLVVDGTISAGSAITLGNINIGVNGRIRFTGSDFEGFFDGTWHSLTAGGGDPIDLSGYCEVNTPCAGYAPATGSTVYANRQLNNLTGVAINANLLPNANNTLNIGSSALAWNNTFTSYLALSETTTPSSLTNFGKLYVKSSDSALYFQDDSGTEYNLLASGSGNVMGAGSANQITFWTGTNTVTGSNDFTWNGSAFSVAGTGLFTGALSANSLTLTNPLAVASGGTGRNTLTTNGVLYGNGTSAINMTAAPTPGQVLLGNSSGVPTFTTITGDITIDANGVVTVTGGGGGDFANRELDNLQNVAINTHLLPDTNDLHDLGSDALRWNSLFIGPSDAGAVVGATIHIGVSTANEATIGFYEPSNTLSMTTNGSGGVKVGLGSEDSTTAGLNVHSGTGVSIFRSGASVTLDGSNNAVVSANNHVVLDAAGNIVLDSDSQVIVGAVDNIGLNSGAQIILESAANMVLQSQNQLVLDSVDNMVFGSDQNIVFTSVSSNILMQNGIVLSTTSNDAYLQLNDGVGATLSAAVKISLQAPETELQGNVVQGSGLATNATDGFLYISSMAGTPVGTPTSYTNTVPLTYDRTNNILYVYNGGWQPVGGGGPGGDFANRELDNLQNVAINADLVPESDGAWSLGQDATRWNQLFVQNTIDLGPNAGDQARFEYVSTQSLDVLFDDGFAFEKALQVTRTGDLVQGLEFEELDSLSTDGFMHVTAMSGTPLNQPTLYNGKVPFTFDVNSNNLWFYNYAISDWVSIGGGGLGGYGDPYSVAIWDDFGSLTSRSSFCYQDEWKVAKRYGLSTDTYIDNADISPRLLMNYDVQGSCVSDDIANPSGKTPYLSIQTGNSWHDLTNPSNLQPSSQLHVGSNADWDDAYWTGSGTFLFSWGEETYLSSGIAFNHECTVNTQCANEFQSTDNFGAAAIAFSTDGAPSRNIRFFTGAIDGVELNNMGSYESMRIDYNGNVGIGETAPGYKLEVNGDFYSSSDITTGGAFFASMNPVSNSTDLCYDSDTGQIGDCASDARLKQNIDYNLSGLNIVNQLKPARFDWINGKSGQTGFIAQDVQAVVPNAVSTAADGYLSFNSSQLLPFVVKATQELDLKVTNVKTQVEALAIELTTLKNTVNAIKTDVAGIKDRVKDLEEKTNTSYPAKTDLPVAKDAAEILIEWINPVIEEDYSVFVTPNWNAGFWISDKNPTSFIIKFANPAPENAKLDYKVEKLNN